MHGALHYINISFCKNVLKQRHCNLCCELYILIYSVILSVFIVVIEKIEVNFCTLLYVYVRIIDFCVLKFMLPACRPNCVEVARTTWKVEQI